MPDSKGSVNDQTIRDSVNDQTIRDQSLIKQQWTNQLSHNKGSINCQKVRDDADYQAIGSYMYKWYSSKGWCNLSNNETNLLSEPRDL